MRFWASAHNIVVRTLYDARSSALMVGYGPIRVLEMRTTTDQVLDEGKRTSIDREIQVWLNATGSTASTLEHYACKPGGLVRCGVGGALIVDVAARYQRFKQDVSVVKQCARLQMTMCIAKKIVSVYKK